MPLIAAALAAGLLPSSVRAQAVSESDPQHVRVHTQIVLIDRAEAQRAGLRYVQVGGGRIWIGGGRDGQRTSRVGASGEVGGIPVSAFVDLARNKRLLRSETQTQVTTLSGSTAAIGSGTLSAGPWGASRTAGPELVVTPTVLPNGNIQLQVHARLRDEVTVPYGYSVDASPVNVATTVVAKPGEAATVGSMSVATEQRDAGLIRWEDVSGSRDVLVVLKPELVSF